MQRATIAPRVTSTCPELLGAGRDTPARPRLATPRAVRSRWLELEKDLQLGDLPTFVRSCM